MNYRSPLYLAVLFVSLTVALIAIGPGLYSDVTFGQWIVSWQREVFSMVCHQQFDRAFHIGQVPMAVCSRCFGIFTLFGLTLITVPFIKQSDTRNRWAIMLVFLALFINVIDFSANAIGIWENTLNSRFLAGASIGFTSALLLGTDNPIKLKEFLNYGT